MDLNIFYKYIKEIYIQQISINTLLKDPINLGKEFNNYLIVNKEWFNKLSKIFEKDDIYQNEDIIFESFSKIMSISKLNPKELNEINYKFIQRKKELEKEDLFKLNLEYESQLKINYPKEFILIEKDSLNKLNLNINYNINDMYTILIGDKYIFLKDKEDNKNIFTCSRDTIFFSVNILFKYKGEDYFNQEINNYIQNKGGLDYYLENGDYKIENTPQNITNSDGDLFGQLLILKYNKAKKHNSSLKSLILSLLNIKQFTDTIINFDKNDKKEIINIIIDFMISYNDKLINELHSKIKEKKKDIIDSNTFKIIIDYILTKLNEELNDNLQQKSYAQIEDYDERQAYKAFEEKYLKYNDSKIKNIFFGIKEMIGCNQCCGLERYCFDIFKYLYINSEILKKTNDLSDCVKEWEKKVINEKVKCNMCLIETDSSIKHKIYEYPEILIIILDNTENKFKIKFNNKLIIKKCEYELISCITNEDYKIIIYKNEKWYILDKEIDYLKEVGNGKIESFLEYLEVLFFKKVVDDNKISYFESRNFTQVFPESESISQIITNKENKNNRYNDISENNINNNLNNNNLINNQNFNNFNISNNYNNNAACIQNIDNNQIKNNNFFQNSNNNCINICNFNQNLNNNNGNYIQNMNNNCMNNGNILNINNYNSNNNFNNNNNNIIPIINDNIVNYDNFINNENNNNNNNNKHIFNLTMDNRKNNNDLNLGDQFKAYSKSIPKQALKGKFNIGNNI